MKIKTNILAIAALLLLFVTGCRKYDDPAPYTPAVMDANMSIKEFKSKYTGQATNIPTYDTTILAGKLISTDQYGNFYRSFFIQDETGGIEVKIGTSGLYNDYKIGQIIYIKPADLTLGSSGRMIDLGYRTADERYQTTWIDVPAIIKATIFRGVQSTPVTPVNITTVADITDDSFGTLVTIKGASYLGGSYRIAGVTYAPWNKWAKKPDALNDDTAYGEQVFVLADNTWVTVRTSGYSRFADATVPFVVGQKGDITGVLTRYFNTIQLVLNTNADVKVLE